MAGTKIVGAIVIGIAAVLALIATFTPWWTISGGGESESAGPFNTNDGMISDGAATTTGILTILAFALMAGAAVLMLVATMTPRTNRAVVTLAPVLGLVGGIVIALGLVLAIFMYPSEASDGGADISFWDEFLGADIGAGFGWYLGAVGAVLGIVGSVVGMMGTSARRGVPA